MSDNDHESRNWRLYIGDMIDFSEAVLSYTAGMDQTECVADRRTYCATLHSLQLIAEAATHVPTAVRDMHPEVRRREISGQGHQPPRRRGHEGLPGVNGPGIGCKFDAT